MKCTCLLAITLALTALGVASACNQPNAPAPAPSIPRDATDAVKGAAPKGWTVSTRGDTLTVRRDKEVTLYNPIGLPPSVDGKPPQGFKYTYEVRLKFRPRMKAEEYAKLAKENETLGAKLEMMRDGLRNARISHKFDDWLPSTPEQKKLVAEYRDAQKGIHRLPDLHNETHSIDVEDSQGYFLLFTDTKDRDECAATKKAVLKLFKSHQPEK